MRLITRLMLPAAVAGIILGGCAGNQQAVKGPDVAFGPTAPAKETAKETAKDGRKTLEASGIKVVRIGRAMNGMMLDLRYRITDLSLAQKVLTRQANMVLIDQQSGKVLSVPNTAKVGKLRQIPNEATKGRLFWVFFNNSDLQVKRGDKVTWKIDGTTIGNIVVD